MRQVGDEELFRFQVAGSVRLRRTLSELGERFSRAIDEEEPDSLAERTVHAWTKPTAILVALSGLGVAIATREIWFAGTPAAGFSLPPADSLSGLVASYGGGWHASGLGSFRPPPRPLPDWEPWPTSSSEGGPRSPPLCSPSAAVVAGSGGDDQAGPPGRGQQRRRPCCRLGLHRGCHLGGPVRCRTVALAAGRRTFAVGARCGPGARRRGLAPPPRAVCPGRARGRVGGRRLSAGPRAGSGGRGSLGRLHPALVCDRHRTGGYRAGPGTRGPVRGLGESVAAVDRRAAARRRNSAGSGRCRWWPPSGSERSGSGRPAWGRWPSAASLAVGRMAAGILAGGPARDGAWLAGWRPRSAGPS